MTFALLMTAAALGLAGVIALKAGEQRALRVSLVAYRLHFPRELETDVVQSLLSGLSGLLPPWWKRWLVSPFVVLEVVADSSGVDHQLLVPTSWANAVGKLLQASTPSVGYEPMTPSSLRCRVAAEYRLSTSARPLRVDAADLSAKLLASLQPLRTGEAVTVQWVIAPHGPVPRVRIAKPGDRAAAAGTRGLVADSEAATALRQKQAYALLLAVGRVATDAPSLARARHLLRTAETSWHGSRAPGVHLHRRSLLPGSASRRTLTRSVPLVVWPGAYNAQELSGLIGWPIGVTSLPGLTLGGCRQLAASPTVPRVGTVIADSTFPGDRRPLALNEQARLRHVHVLGPTGTGKSTLLVNMAASDLAAGYGVVLLDPKGDLVDDVLARVPEFRRDDVVVLDPADETHPVGLNPLRAAHGASAEVVVENLVALFKSLYRSSWGPRTDDILRAALLTLAGAGDTTLCEVPLLLTDPNYRRRLVGALDDPVGLESFWGWYEALSDAERLSVVGPVLNKVRAFTMRPRVRAIIGQATPQLALPDVLASNKVLLVSLGSGVLGEEAAALLGALVVAELWHATTARAGLPRSQRRPVMAYLDEWQHFLHLPTPMASVLAEARGMGLGMTLAHQHLGQLTDETRSAVLSNARSRVVFQLPNADARLVARELGGLLSVDDLQGLGAFEVACQLFAAGNTQPVATARTRPAVQVVSDGAAIRNRARRLYGIERGEVEAAIRSRQSGRSGATAVRRRRRDGGFS